MRFKPGPGPQGERLADTAWISLQKEETFFASTESGFLDESEAGQIPAAAASALCSLLHHL
jgi:hypothetical protein